MSDWLEVSHDFRAWVMAETQADCGVLIWIPAGATCRGSPARAPVEHIPTSLAGRPA